MPGLQIPERLPFRLTEPVRLAADDNFSRGRVLVASGTQSRNRDFWTGKPFRLLPSGMRLTPWQANGSLVLWMHNFNIPLGRGEMFMDGGQLWAWEDIEFHNEVIPIATQNWIGDAIGQFDTGVIARLWNERILNAVSIHVMFTKEDEENIIETDDEIIFPTSEVIEFSIVTVPGDREAVRQNMVRMGMDGRVAQALCEGNACQMSGKKSNPVSTTTSRLFVPPQGGWPVSSSTNDSWTIVAPNGEPTAFSEPKPSKGFLDAVREAVKDAINSLNPASSGGSKSSVEEEDMSLFKSLGDEAEEPVSTAPPAAGPAQGAQPVEPVADEEEVVDAAEEVAETAEETTYEIEMDPRTVAEAIVADAEALQVLAQGLAESAEARAILVQGFLNDEHVRQLLVQAAVSQSAAPPPTAERRVVLKINGTPQAQEPQSAPVQSQPQTQMSIQRMAARQNRIAANSTPVPANDARQRKPSSPVLRMHRPTP